MVSKSQRERNETVKTVQRLISIHGGMIEVSANRHEFLGLVAYTIGCTRDKAQDYLETIISATVFEARIRDTSKEAQVEIQVPKEIHEDSMASISEASTTEHKDVKVSRKKRAEAINE